MFKSGLAALAIGLAINQASASLTLDLRATSKTVGGITTTNLGGASTGASAVFGAGLTSVSGLNIGDSVTFTLFAYVHSELSNPEDGGNGNGATNFQGFQNAFGSVLMSLGGGITGNWTAQAAQQGLVGGLFFNGTGRYGAAGAQPGTIQDLNGDGQTDIGSNSTVPTSTQLVFARAGSMITTNGGAGIATPISGDSLTTQFNVATMKFTITGLSGSNQSGFVWRNVNFPNGADIPALWQEDSIARNSKASGGILLAGSGVQLIAIPEPAAFGMLLLGGVGMVGFRRLGIRKA